MCNFRLVPLPHPTFCVRMYDRPWKNILSQAASPSSIYDGLAVHVSISITYHILKEMLLSVPTLCSNLMNEFKMHYVRRLFRFIVIFNPPIRVPQ